MDLLFDNRLWKINIFILLTFFIRHSCNVSLSALKEICCIDSGIKDIDTFPSNSNCTAIAWVSDSITSLANINHLNGKLKKVYVYNQLDFDHYRYYMSPPHMNDFLMKIRQRISDNNVDILIFNGIFRDNYIYGYNNLLQMDIRRLFLRLKKTNPNVLCGIFIRYLPDTGVNLKYLEKVVPFFVLKSFANYYCYHKEEQADMDHLDSPNEIEDKVKKVLSIVNSKRLGIGIRILVQSTKKGIASHEDDDTYTNFCTRKASKHRRFCIETLANFYKKGRLVSKYSLAGAFILGFDRDDHGCKCGCGCYPVMTVIDAGIKGLPEPQLTNCSTWTLLKKDRD